MTVVLRIGTLATLALGAMGALGCDATPDAVVPADGGSTDTVQVHDAPVTGTDGTPVTDAGMGADVPVATDVPVAADVPVATDVPTAMDTPTVTDAPLGPDGPVDGSPDVPATMDVPTVRDGAPAMDVPVCPVLPAPAADVDPWTVSLPDLGTPVTRMVTTGGHRDLYLSGPGGVAELGVRLDWGGAVVFFGQAGAPLSNTVDGNDTGRELQLALYDPQRAAQGCAYNATCAGPGPCPGSISYLGWDPVQGGDRCGHGTPVLHSGVEGNQMVLGVQPLQWNPDWNATDCHQTPCGAAGVPTGVTYTLGFRFVHPNVVEVAMEVASTEALDHHPSGQEFPTLYVGHGGPATDLPLLLDAAGTPIAITEPGNDGFTHQEFLSPEPWVTWQHAARDYGVGLAMDNGVTGWQGWQGDGTHAPYFHNVRAIQSFGLPPHGVVRGRAWMTLGSFDTVRALTHTVLAQRPPFGVLDSPPTGLTAVDTGGTLHLAGWALDNAAGVSVIARVDGHDVATLPRTTPRADVCAVYPNYTDCPAVGFDAVVPLGLTDTCTHALDVMARDADGNVTPLAHRRVTAH